MISIIIPTLNEEKVLPATLNSLDWQIAGEYEYEVIIVDGQSSDRTRAIARQYSQARLISGARGRASQMNAGAKQASGRWLLFLHADTLLPPLALAKIAAAGARDGTVFGCFRHRFSDNHGLLRLISWLHDWRCRSTRIVYGDQAMFVKRSTFRQLGGFPETQILEDILLSEKLAKLGKPVQLDATVTTASRKFVQRGICRSFFEVLVILLCHKLRLPIQARGFFSPIR